MLGDKSTGEFFARCIDTARDHGDRSHAWCAEASQFAQHGELALRDPGIRLLDGEHSVAVAHEPHHVSRQASWQSGDAFLGPRTQWNRPGEVDERCVGGTSDAQGHALSLRGPLRDPGGASPPQRRPHSVGPKRNEGRPGEPDRPSLRKRRYLVRRSPVEAEKVCCSPTRIVTHTVSPFLGTSRGSIRTTICESPAAKLMSCDAPNSFGTVP